MDKSKEKPKDSGQFCIACGDWGHLNDKCQGPRPFCKKCKCKGHLEMLCALSVGAMNKISAMCSRAQHSATSEMPSEEIPRKQMVIIDHCSDVHMVRDPEIPQSIVEVQCLHLFGTSSAEGFGLTHAGILDITLECMHGGQLPLECGRPQTLYIFAFTGSM